ncbi:MAG: CheR family methyltransferase [Gemmatimonadaceae bacterium]
MTHGDDAGFRALMDKITRDRGFQCSSYKDKCLRRRIGARMRARNASTCDEYARILSGDPREYDRLMKSLTVNVTKFFRNRETFTAIDQKVIPSLMDASDREIRVWSAGCASGEEPYSLAMLMHAAATSAKDVQRLDAVSIVGTDIDTTSLENAKLAVYGEQALAETPLELRKRYFHEVSGLFTLAPEPRGPVSFVCSDLLHFRSPVEQAHLIMCRNVIIYFEREAQDALFSHFYETLAPGGFLVLGKVETLLGKARELFSPVNARERIFRKI